jgi:hypothetical protein
MITKSPYENADFMAEYTKNSMTRDSPQMRSMCAAVKEADTFVVLGYSERDKGSSYISQV